MSSGAGRDAWLYQEYEARKRAVAKGETRSGYLDLNTPVSDMTFRMLTGAYAPQGPRITDWGGGQNDPTSLAVSVVRKAAPDYPASRQLKDPFEGLYSQGIALEPPLPPDRLLNLTEENTLHSGCLMAKAVDACGRGWSFKPKKGKAAGKVLLKSDLPDKMKEGMELITPDMTFGEMLYQAAWEKEAIGWSAWETVRMVEKFKPGAYASIGAVYPVPAFTLRATIDPRRWVQIRAGRVRFFKKYGAKCEVDAETGQVWSWQNEDDMKALSTVDPNRLASELIIFKEYTPRSLWYGIPKWISCVPTIAELTAIREFNVSWFASGGQTDYIVHFKSESIEVATKMRDDARQQMQENQGRGHTNILVAGTENSEVSAQKLGELLREGHFRFRRGDLAKEVLIAHNVPPYRIGWAETGSLGGNAAVEMLGAYKFGAIQPIQSVIEDRLMNTMFNPELGGIDTGEFKLKLEELVLDDLTKEIEIVIRKVDSAIMTPNEAREELGMERIEDEPEDEKQPKPGDGLPEDAQAIEGGPNAGDPTQKAEPQPFEPARPQDPNLSGRAPAMLDGEEGPLPTKKPSQAEVMNKFYYKGHELGTQDSAPGATMGPDGKPAMPFAPGAKPNMGPDGSPLPDTSEKSVDKTVEVITSFEKALREALRSEGTAVVNGADTSELPPSERRPSRRSRRQTI